MWVQREVTLRPRPRGFHLVTGEIESAVPELRSVRVGLAHLFIRHTSASLTLNENASPDVRDDFEAYFNEAVPEDARYWTHTIEGPDDMPAHIKASLLGPSLSLPVRDGRLALGTWQGVYSVRAPQPRRRALCRGDAVRRGVSAATTLGTPRFHPPRPDSVAVLCRVRLNCGIETGVRAGSGILAGAMDGREVSFLPNSSTASGDRAEAHRVGAEAPTALPGRDGLGRNAHVIARSWRSPHGNTAWSRLRSSWMPGSAGARSRAVSNAVGSRRSTAVCTRSALRMPGTGARWRQYSPAVMERR